MLPRTLVFCASFAFLLAAPAVAQEEEASASMAWVYVTTVKPGHQQQYEAALAKVAAASKKVNSPVKWTTSVTAIGGNGPTYISVIPMKTFGDIDGWAGFGPAQVLTNAYGEKEAEKVLQSMAQTIVSSSTSIIALRPDLGHQ